MMGVLTLRRIAFIASEYPPYVYGGLGTHVEALSTILASRGDRVDLYVPSRDSYVQPPNGVHLCPILAREPDNSDGNISFWVDFCTDVANTITTGTQRYDLVHAHDWMAALAGTAIRQRCATRFVFSVHLPQSIDPHQLIESFGLEAADLVLVNSISVEREVVDRSPGIHSISVIPNGVDSSFFEAAEDWDHMKTSNILFVGRLVPQKGVDTLLQAYAVLRERITDVHLCIVGDGDYNLYLQRLSRYFGVSSAVTFCGWKVGKSLREFYRKSAVVVMPSRYEPFGIVALEAMSCGVPIVASRVGGLVDIVEDGRSGFLVTPGDHLALAQRMMCLIRNRELHDSLSNQARHRALEYSWERVADETSKQYEMVLGTSTVPRRPPQRDLEGKLSNLGASVRAAVADLLGIVI